MLLNESGNQRKFSQKLPSYEKLHRKREGNPVSACGLATGSPRARHGFVDFAKWISKFRGARADKVAQWIFFCDDAWAGIPRRYQVSHSLQAWCILVLTCYQACHTHTQIRKSAKTQTVYNKHTRALQHTNAQIHTPGIVNSRSGTPSGTMSAERAGGLPVFET